MTNKDLIMELVNNLEVKSKNAESIAKILDCDIDGKVCDVVEVVRCKDCEYARSEGRENVYICAAKTNPNYCWFDEYCSCGERRETE